MPKPNEIIDMAASLMNDTAQTVYTDAAVLPYLNMALDDLQETFEQNNIPVTNQVSTAITLPAGTTILGYGTTPALPADLIEIQYAYERTSGVIPWIPMSRKEFIPKQHEDQSITQFLWWSWVDQEMHFIAATSDIDIKLDYIQKIFNTPIAIADIAVDIPIPNVKQSLGYATAALCSMFVGENETRAQYLEGLAQRALDRELGIPIKGRQAITTRRQPFMGSYRRRGYI